MGHAVAKLVEALRYKPEGRGFDPDGVLGTMALGSNQTLTEMRGKGGGCVGLILTLSYIDCLEIWDR